MGLAALVNSVIPKFWVNLTGIKQLMLPITILGWSTGRGIIEMPHGNCWPVTSCIYSFLLVFGFCAAVKATTVNIEHILVSTSTVGSLMINFALYSNICVVICNSLNGWMAMRGMNFIMDALQVVGEKISNVGLAQKHRSLCRRHLIILTGEIVFIIYTIVISYILAPTEGHMLWYEIATTISLHYPIIALSIGDATFVTLIRCLNIKFEQLNKVLKEMLPKMDDSPQHKRVLAHTISKRRNNDVVSHEFEEHTNDDPKVIRKMLENHYELTSIGCSINQTFGTQALLSLSYSFYLLVGLLYRTSALLLWSHAKKNLIEGEVISLLSWVLFTAYKIIKMSSACAKASNECKETAVIICQLHEPSRNKVFRDAIADFSLQMTQHTLEFSACGLFPIDHSLLQAMVGSIATYLVILVQIGDTPTPTALTPSTTALIPSEPPTPLPQ